MLFATFQKLKPVLHLAVLYFMPVALAAQGPLDGFLKGKGVLDLAPSFSFLNARRFDGANKQTYDEAYRGNMLSLFAEYGLSSRLDLVATVPLVFTSVQSGLQDGGFYLKYRPLYKTGPTGSRLGLLAGAGISAPLSNYEPVSTGALGVRAVALPARLIAQWESRRGFFLNLSGGYTWRLDRLHDADVARIRQQRPDYQPRQPPGYATGLFKIGFPAAHYYLDAWLEWQHSIGGADYAPLVPDLPQAYGVSYLQLGGTAFYSENGKNGFFLSGGYITHGRNVSRIARITLGFVLKVNTLLLRQERR